MTTRTVDELGRLSREILLAAGASEENAQRVSEALVKSDLRGVRSHGIRHLPGYVGGIRKGNLLPAARPEIREESPTTALITGNWSFGHVAAKLAMDTAISKADEHRVAVVGLVEAHHIGRLGEYAEMAAERGLISMILSGGYGVSHAVAVPYGGRRPILSTNPLAMGFPAGQGPPVIIDYATTKIAGSKVVQTLHRGESLPPNILLDKEGKPTTDPAAFYDGGGLLPFGEHKGYALMLAAELWGRILTGADRFAIDPRGGVMKHTGTTMVVFRGDLFQPLPECLERTDQLQDQIHAVPPAAGFEEVLVPGDLEDRRERKQRRDGILVPEEVWKQLMDVRTELGLPDTDGED